MLGVRARRVLGLGGVGAATAAILIEITKTGVIETGRSSGLGGMGAADGHRRVCAMEAVVVGWGAGELGSLGAGGVAAVAGGRLSLRRDTCAIAAVLR